MLSAPAFRVGLAAIALACALTVSSCAEPTAPAAGGPVRQDTANSLPSWHEGPVRAAITGYVDRVTTPGHPAFIPAAERIAVFDNDGTLWAEQPVYFQLFFAMDRIRALAPEHPEWQQRQPFRSVLEGDMETLIASGKAGLLELVMASHAGMTTEEFDAIVTDWIGRAKHPQLQRPYTELVYQPMLELLAYLRAHDFKTYIVSGGGIEFMRPWTEAVYGIPPEQVVGSSIKVSFAERDGTPVLVRQPEIYFIDDRAGKPVGIHQHIGRRPVMAFGNSDGDLEMLQWTSAGAYESLAVLVHHTDAEREWAYDRDSSIGRLDAALDAARQNDWVVIDMQRDWRTIYPGAVAPAGAAD